MKNEKIGVGARIYLLIATAFFLFPFLICILMSVKSKQDRGGVLALSQKIHWENFSKAIESANIVNSMKNSLIITIASVIIIVFVSATAGYAIGRQYHKRFYRIYESILVASMMIPFQAVMIPVYKMYCSLGLFNSRTGAVIMISGMAIAYCTIMIIGFVRRIPIELEEAAMIDGCGRGAAFFRIILPLSRPIILSVTLIMFLNTWSQFQIPLILASSMETKPMAIVVSEFMTKDSIQYGLIAAAGMTALIPPALTAMLFRKYLISGMMGGSVKG